MFPVTIKTGSWLDLDPALVPEAEKAIPVVKEWLREFFFTASFSKIGWLHFLTNIGHIVALTVFLEQENAVSYFKRAACINTERPPLYMRIGDRYVVHDLVDFLCYEGIVALSAGTLFIK